MTGAHPRAAPADGPWRVERWLEEDDAAWDALCDRHGDLFQTSAVSRAAQVFGTETRRVRVLDAEGRPLAAFAIVEVGSRKAPLADALFARRFHVQGGPFALTDGIEPDPVRLIETGLDLFAAERSATESDWKPTWAVAPERPAPDDGWTHEAFGMAWRTLPEEPDDVLATLSRSHRKAVRRAESSGVVVRPSATPTEVFDLVDRSFARSGLSTPNREFLERLRSGLAARDRLIELVAEGPGGPLAALLAARTGDTVFNLFHGRTDGDTSGAANLLHLRLFEQGALSGARRVHTGDAAITDDGTTGTEGILRFKRHLGFEIVPCLRARKVHRPLARKVGQGVLSAYRFLRGGPA